VQHCICGKEAEDDFGIDIMARGYQLANTDPSCRDTDAYGAYRRDAPAEEPGFYHGRFPFMMECDGPVRRFLVQLPHGWDTLSRIPRTSLVRAR
jgi:hypothetical protein